MRKKNEGKSDKMNEGEKHGNTQREERKREERKRKMKSEGGKREQEKRRKIM